MRRSTGRPATPGHGSAGEAVTPPWILLVDRRKGERDNDARGFHRRQEDGVRRPGHRSRRRATEWAGLETRLAKALACLEDGHFLILSTRNDDPYYVQFAAGGPQGMRAEAVSNRFLEGWRRLDRTAEDRLRRLGWRPPTDIGDGPVNWWRSFDTPLPVAGIAS